MSKDDEKKLSLALSDAIAEAESKETPVGQYGWIPCAGRPQNNIPIGHVGVLRISVEKGGHTRWEATEPVIWLTKDEALSRYDGIVIGVSSHTVCDDCKKFH